MCSNTETVRSPTPIDFVLYAWSMRSALDYRFTPLYMCHLCYANASVVSTTTTWFRRSATVEMPWFGVVGIVHIETKWRIYIVVLARLLHGYRVHGCVISKALTTFCRDCS